jgi:DNA invertase Pin-like site-specific DNA recombinase
VILSYTRVSTADQAEDGATSLAEQERRNRAVATIRSAGSFDFVNFVDAGVSGTIPLAERPAGKDLLQTAKSGDIIVATKMDRMFRSARDALVTADDLKKRGVDLILSDISTDPVTGNGVGKLFFGILASVAEFDRDRILERTREGTRAKKRNGGHTGGQPPFGFRKVGFGRDARLEPDTEEQDVIQLARDINAQHGYKRLHRVAKALNELGIRSRAGGELQRIQVVRMLRNEEARS